MVALCLAAGAGSLLASAPASACGPLPDVAYPVSPATGAVDVPLNAALVASSVFRPVRFTLQELDTGRAVPLTVSCETEAGPQLCLGRPGLLAANTAYVWTVEPDPRPGEEPPKPGSAASTPAQFRFTTGDRTDQTAPLSNLTPDPAPSFTVDILEHRKVPQNTCGIADNARMRIAVPRLDEPAVLVGSGMGGLPQAWDQEAPPLLRREARSAERMFYAAPDCLALRLIDVAGNVRHLPPWCPPAPPAAPAPASVAKPEGELAASCGAIPGRVTGGSSPVVALVGLASALVARRRRPPR
jgi:hypothetical protein